MLELAIVMALLPLFIYAISLWHVHIMNYQRETIQLFEVATFVQSLCEQSFHHAPSTYQRSAPKNTNITVHYRTEPIDTFFNQEHDIRRQENEKEKNYVFVFLDVTYRGRYKTYYYTYLIGIDHETG